MTMLGFLSCAFAAGAVAALKSVATMGIVRLAHRSLSPVGEIFARTLQEIDAELTEFERKNAPKMLHPRRRTRYNARFATRA